MPPDTIIGAEKFPAIVQKELHLTAAAVKEGNDTAFNEAGYLPTLRFNARGTRQVLTCALFPLLLHLGGGTLAQTKDARDLLCKVPTSEDARATLAKHAAKHAVYHTTVGLNDVLYTPAAWITLERTGTADNVVYKIPAVSQHDVDALEKVYRHNLVHGAEWNTKLVDTIALL